jgi:hypothetical protein
MKFDTKVIIGLSSIAVFIAVLVAVYYIKNRNKSTTAPHPNGPHPHPNPKPVVPTPVVPVPFTNLPIGTRMNLNCNGYQLYALKDDTVVMNVSSNASDIYQQWQIEPSSLLNSVSILSVTNTDKELDVKSLTLVPNNPTFGSDGGFYIMQGGFSNSFYIVNGVGQYMTFNQGAGTNLYLTQFKLSWSDTPTNWTYTQIL